MMMKIFRTSPTVNVRRSPPMQLVLRPSRCSQLTRQSVVLHSAAAANPGGISSGSLDLPQEMSLASSTAAPVAPIPTKDGVAGAMLEPSVSNTQWVMSVLLCAGSSILSLIQNASNLEYPKVRALAILAAVSLVSGSSIWMPTRVVTFIHVISYGLMLGTAVWNTFFVGLTMFKNMPRQMFGRVQSKLFPMYFGLTSACNTLMIGTFLFSQGLTAATLTQPVISLAVALVSSLANWFWLEPLCTGLMFERYDLENKVGEKTEADKVKIGELYKEFGKWHGVSSLVNLVILCCVIAHGWTLSAGMTLGLAL